jgi:hypothetical protein
MPRIAAMMAIRPSTHCHRHVRFSSRDDVGHSGARLAPESTDGRIITREDVGAPWFVGRLAHPDYDVDDTTSAA